MPVSNLFTGEIIAEAGEKISKAKAIEIENAGVKETYVEAENCTEELGAKIISNGMVDLAACLESWLGGNYKKFAEKVYAAGINEKVSAEVLMEIVNECGEDKEALEAKVLEHKCRLAVEGACAPCLVDRLVDLVLEVSVGNGGADAVRVRMQVADDVDLADCLWHESPSVLCAPCLPSERSRPYRCIPSPSIVPPVVTKKMHAWVKPQVLGMQRHPIVHKR